MHLIVDGDLCVQMVDGLSIMHGKPYGFGIRFGPCNPVLFVRGNVEMVACRQRNLDCVRKGYDRGAFQYQNPFVVFLVVPAGLG